MYRICKVMNISKTLSFQYAIYIKDKISFFFLTMSSKSDVYFTFIAHFTFILHFGLAIVQLFNTTRS